MQQLKNLSSSSFTSTQTPHLICVSFIWVCICICIMFTILRLDRHCPLINHYSIHMWSLTAFQRTLLIFQVEGCSTDRDYSLYMDLVHSLHFEFHSLMDAEEIWVYYDYFVVFIFCRFLCTHARVSKFSYSAQFAKVCHFCQLTHRTVRSFRIYIILMTIAIELAVCLTFDIRSEGVINTDKCVAQRENPGYFELSDW